MNASDPLMTDLVAKKVAPGLYAVEGAYNEPLDPFKAWPNLSGGPIDQSTSEIKCDKTEPRDPRES
jgi:hypothetical protein